jgi:hypothetical protein
MDLNIDGQEADVIELLVGSCDIDTFLVTSFLVEVVILVNFDDFSLDEFSSLI